MKKLFILLIHIVSVQLLFAENGYRLWLRYDLIQNSAVLNGYRMQVSSLQFAGNSPTISVAKLEMTTALESMLGKKIALASSLQNAQILAGTPSSSSTIASLHHIREDLAEIADDGFIIFTANILSKKVIVITAKTDIGVLYGSFHLLRLMQTNQPIDKLSITSSPKIKLRLLNHWDNLTRYVERGYAGISIWNWQTLPGYIDKRYVDYARANASIGINGTVLTNVNANALVLSNMYLEKVAALAEVFRPYGIKVYLTARFSAPVEAGGLKTADPLDPAVQQWWKNKVDSIYKVIPDFGGFLVKANSEGQPGPQNYGRTHADGANMLANALAPHKGIVMWRAFVYSNETPDDRFKQAYNEFKPLDGKFNENVLVQVKNGPIDFQPREPFHPLFGAMPKTPIMMEFQLTQEYLGYATHLVFLPSMYKEVLSSDTYAKGKGSTVAKVVEGNVDTYSLTGMAGVSNIGNEINWTGHPFGQANWYGLGRLAWDPDLSASTIADEWARQTFSNQPSAVAKIKKIMLASHDAVVNYMTPLGLNHIMGYGHHYGPAPWWDRAPRADWNPVYFHKADNAGIGFDRTAKGSNALAQYFPDAAKEWLDINKCPDDYLLWFHHASWDHKMHSGRTLWEELCVKYQSGVDTVRWMQQQWNSMKSAIDPERFEQVKMLIAIQEKEAVWWRDACLLYFQTFSKQPLPKGYEQPAHSLEYYKALRFPYAPGNGN